MKESTLDRYQQAKAKVDGGMTIEEACKDAEIGVGTWYAMKKRRGTYKKTTAKFVDLPIKTSSTKIAVVLCSPSQLMEVLGGLQ